MEDVARAAPRTTGRRRRRRREAALRLGSRGPGSSGRGSGRPRRTASMLNVTGWSNSSTLDSVMAQSCTIGLSATGTSTTRRTWPSVPMVRYFGGTPLPLVGHRVQLAGGGVPVGMGGEAAGQRAVEVAVGHRLEIVGQLDRQRRRPRRSRTSGPAWPITLVLAPSLHAVAGTGNRRTPSAAAVSSLRTYRLRYHSALPSRSRRPCTMPVPMNQWCSRGIGVDDRVRSDAQEASVEIGRNPAVDFELGDRALVVNRGEVALELLVHDRRGRIRRSSSVMVSAMDPFDQTSSPPSPRPRSLVPMLVGVSVPGGGPVRGYCSCSSLVR